MLHDYSLKVILGQSKTTRVLGSHSIAQSHLAACDAGKGLRLM